MEPMTMKYVPEGMCYVFSLGIDFDVKINVNAALSFVVLSGEIVMNVNGSWEYVTWMREPGDGKLKFFQHPGWFTSRMRREVQKALETIPDWVMVRLMRFKEKLIQDAIRDGLM